MKTDGEAGKFCVTPLQKSYLYYPKFRLMKALLFTLLVIPILSCNQVGEKEPQITKADSIAMRWST